MSESIEVNSVSVHVRYSSQASVADALARLGVARNTPVPVWPPHRLPYGLLVSGLRDGWISIWSPLENVREWFPRLTATLECPGVLLQVIQSRFWVVELFRDGDFLGRLELPEEAVRYDALWALTVESLEAEGVPEPWEDEERFGARLDEVARSSEYEEDMRRMEAERPAREALLPFLPPHADLNQAWELLTTAEAPEGRGEFDEPDYAEDSADAFASYLGIRDATWDPREDAEALAEGEYE
ncbi:MAG TPA: hypothetical protein VFU47_15370, partial [Armatimonadota bacterium]|nr:hypothetical protein [Armatimonadota bacterium]